MLMSAEMCEDIQASDYDRKLGEQPDDCIAVSQPYTHIHTDVVVI